MNRKRVFKILKNVLLLACICIQTTIYAQDDFDVVENDSATYFEKIDTAQVTIVQERKINDSVINSLKLDEDFWYANRHLQKPKPVPVTTPFLIKLMQQQWVRTLLWIIMATTFVAVLAWYLTSFNIHLFRNRPASIRAKNEDELADDIFSIDYESELANAIQKSKYNLAVRLLYLQLLTQLSHKGIIRYGQDRTNSDYLLQLYNTSYYKDFFRLTREFEYSWYGQFAVSPTAFEIINKDFESFKQRLRF